jgi:hypothetical protein
VSAFKASKPKANPPICWECGKKLYGGGRFYEVVNVDGYDRIVHRDCRDRIVEEGR